MPELNNLQLSKLADIASEIALVSLASVALPVILEQPDLTAMIAGIIATLFFWTLSLWILKVNQ